jgi:cell division protein FtsL
MRGRSIVALGLLGFVLIAAGVIWRRSVGVAETKVIQDLERKRADLDARRASLEGQIRDATSRARLARVAEERLGMHVPSDSQVITLVRSNADGAGK